MYHLTSANLSVTVDPATGQIRSMIDRSLNRDYCQLESTRFGMIGGIRVKDMLSGQTFDDFNTPSVVNVVEWKHSQAGARLVLDKQFDGAGFIARIEYKIDPSCLQLDAYVRKTSGPDRQIRFTWLMPMPYTNLWAPMSDPIVRLRWEEPFQVRHGLSYGRAVQPQHRTAPIPIVTLFERSHCLAYSMPPDVPNVCVRFMNNASEDSLFLLNSITDYPIEQRPHFKIVNDYLSLREGKETRFSLLISTHNSQWRDALGWYANRYSAWFQPDPKIRAQEGVYAISTPWDRWLGDEALSEKRMAGRAARGVGWMELHGHFPWYGLYVHPTDNWQGHHEAGSMSFDSVRRYIDLANKHGIALHIYYNVIDGQIFYANKEFPESIVRDESGKIVPAFHDCHLMNADLSLPFGKHCLEQFQKLLSTYPNINGVFFDVYGRHYNLDFGHDDGLTMVNNKPAYCLKFAFQRLMDKIDPLMRQKGLVFSANKPEGIELMKGIDYIMADEGADEDRLQVMQYYGLFKPIIILDGGIVMRAEEDFKKCLRLGMIYNDIDPDREMKGKEFTDEMRARAAKALEAYAPLFPLLKGKTWVLKGDPVELPPSVRGNIFERPNKDYIVTMVSDDRSVFDDLSPRKNLKVTIRIADADKYTEAEVWSADYKDCKKATIDRGSGAAGSGIDIEKWKEEEAIAAARSAKVANAGDALVITVPEHKSASIVVLKRTK
jgi:hypothetical protein